MPRPDGLMRRGAFLAALGGAATLALIARRAPAAGSYQVTHTDAEWRRILGNDRYAIMREAGTEEPGSSPLNAETRPGIYDCYGCNLPLFSSKAKYDAGEGWPSFWTVLPNVVQSSDDRSLIENRTEIHCRRCGSHLGHLFDDGPRPTGLRYCIDGLALRFVPKG